jgi:signal transduction histidine kinase
LVIACAIAVLVVFWGVAGLWLWRDHSRTTSSAEDELARISIGVAEHTRRLLSLADIFLDSLEQTITLGDGSPEGLAGPEISNRVASLLSHSDGVLDVGVVDHAGQRMLLPHDPARPVVSVQDRDYVKRARTGAITLSHPIRGRASGEWIIPVSRRMSDPNHPVAVIYVTLHVPALERIFDGVRRSKEGAVGLFTTEGMLLARAPSLESAIGRIVADGHVFKERLPLAPEGLYITVSKLDGLERLGAYRSIAPHGLVVLVSETLDEVLTEWRRRLWLALAVAGVVTLMVCGGTLVLLRLLRSLEEGARVLDRRVGERTAELQRLMEARSNFLAFVSHELRTPLNAIIGFTDALISGIFGPASERQIDYLRDIHRSGRHLLALVNDLLDSAAVDAGRLRLDESEFNLGDMVAEVESMLRERAGAAKVALDIAGVDGGLTILADRRRLLQAVLNLSSNAIKYNRPGGRVGVAAQLDSEGKCVLAISDDGIGMNADDLKVAMIPFGRASDSSTHAIEGTGLGLPLTANIIELHGGMLKLDSTPGFGTTVAIVLPASRIIHPSEEGVDTLKQAQA